MHQIMESKQKYSCLNKIHVKDEIHSIKQTKLNIEIFESMAKIFLECPLHILNTLSHVLCIVYSCCQRTNKSKHCISLF